MATKDKILTNLVLFDISSLVRKTETNQVNRYKVPERQNEWIYIRAYKLRAIDRAM